MTEAKVLSTVVSIPLTDSQRYAFECPEGHKNVVVIIQTRFEILAEVGMQAIVDGYYRDAVSSFSASLERLYELHLRIICAHKGIDEKELSKAWKDIQNQSERQLGLFVGLFLSENGRAAPMLDTNTATKMRNNVIHKGYIPTRDDAIFFAQAVSNVVQPIINNMVEKYPDVLLQHVGSQRRKARASDPHAVYWMKNMVFHLNGSPTDVSVDIKAELDRRQRNRVPGVINVEPLHE